MCGFTKPGPLERNEVVFFAKDHEEVNRFSKRVKNIGFVTTELQVHLRNSADVYILFYGRIEKYLSMSSRMNSKFSLVESFIFEEKLRKLKCGEELTLKEIKQRAIQHLQKVFDKDNIVHAPIGRASPVSFALQLRKKTR